MTKPQLQRVEELFHKAADLAPDQRSAFLDRECAADPDLRAAVEEVLQHDDASLQTRDFLASPIGRLGETAGLPKEGPTFLASSPASAASAQPLPPAMPGYEILSELGRGGMGVVYKARHFALNRLVALKMLLAGGSASAVQRARFRTEAEAMARLNHPNIVEIFEVGEYENRPFFAMEYVPGPSLAQFLDGTPLPFQPAAQLVECLARAVSHAHEHGILHRDLKPGNILLASGGREPPGEPSPGGSRPPLADQVPKITDFGLARDETAEQRMTQTGQGMGTPSYMAPEQARGDVQAVGPAVDIYALGSILYELLTGRPPFEEATPAETMMRLLSDEPLSPARLRAKLPRDLETICLKCLEKEPRKRYASALDLAEDLRRFQAGQPIRARPIGSIERAWRWCRRRPVVAALLAVSAVLALALVGSVLVYNAQLEHALARSEKTAESERQQVVLLNITLGMHDVEKGDALTGLVWLTEALRRDENRADEVKHRVRIGTVLRQCPRLLQLLVLDKPVLCTRFTVDGCQMATEGEQGAIRVWDVRKGLPAGPDLKHARPVAQAEFSTDGRLLATVDRDGKARVWSVRTGKLHYPPLALGRPVREVAFDAGGSHLLVRRARALIELWELAGGKRIIPEGLPEGAPRFSACSENGRWLFIVDAKQTGRVWDLNSGKLMPGSVHLNNVVDRGAISPDGRRVALVDPDNSVRIWEVASSKEIGGPLAHRDPVRISFDCDGSRLLTISGSRAAWLWKAAGGDLIASLPGHNGDILRARFSPFLPILVTCGADNRARVWDSTTGELVYPLLRHNGSVVEAAFDPLGMQLVTAGQDGTVRLWALEGIGGTPVKNELAFGRADRREIKSPHGRRSLRWKGGHTVQVIDGTTGKSIGRALHHGSIVTHADFSPDGKRVATSSDDNTARVWDAETGEPLIPPLEHKGTVRSVAFSPDGSQIITASEDGTARVWDAGTGLPLTPPLVYPSTTRLKLGPPFVLPKDVPRRNVALPDFLHASFSRHGRRAITGRPGWEERSWDLAPDDRSVSELVLLAHVLSGCEIEDGHGLVPLSAARLRNVWKSFNAASGVAGPQKERNK